MLAADATDYFLPEENILSSLQKFYTQNNDWLFGHFNYDFKNNIEQLSSSHTDHIQFPDVFLFHPQTVIKTDGDKIIISCLHHQPAAIFETITATELQEIQLAKNIKIKARIIWVPCFFINRSGLAQSKYLSLSL